MKHSLPLITYLAHDYDEAIDWFTRALQFTLLEDTDEGRKRWVRMAPHPNAETAFLIAQASTPEQKAIVGNQHGGRVGFFLHTDDFEASHAHMISQGVTFRETPRHEAYGTVAVFEDLYGAPWDLIQFNSVAKPTP